MIKVQAVHNRIPRELGYYQAAEWDKHVGAWQQRPNDRINDGIILEEAV